RGRRRAARGGHQPASRRGRARDHRCQDDGAGGQRRGGQLDPAGLPRLVRPRGAPGGRVMSVRRILLGLGGAVLALMGYLCVWPVPIDPVSWDAPTATGYVGAYAPNTRLVGLRAIEIGNEVGPEHIAIGPDGKL